jgi:hypothetical protein
MREGSDQKGAAGDGVDHERLGDGGGVEQGKHAQGVAIELSPLVHRPPVLWVSVSKSRDVPI